LALQGATFALVGSGGRYAIRHYRVRVYIRFGMPIGACKPDIGAIGTEFVAVFVVGESA